MDNHFLGTKLREVSRGMVNNTVFLKTLQYSADTLETLRLVGYEGGQCNSDAHQFLLHKVLPRCSKLCTFSYCCAPDDQSIGEILSALRVGCAECLRELELYQHCGMTTDINADAPWVRFLTDNFPNLSTFYLKYMPFAMPESRKITPCTDARAAIKVNSHYLYRCDQLSVLRPGMHVEELLMTKAPIEYLACELPMLKHIGGKPRVLKLRFTRLYNYMGLALGEMLNGLPSLRSLTLIVDEQLQPGAEMTIVHALMRNPKIRLVTLGGSHWGCNSEATEWLGK